jgi:hypothetical protein
MPFAASRSGPRTAKAGAGVGWAANGRWRPYPPALHAIARMHYAAIACLYSSRSL